MTQHTLTTLVPEAVGAWTLDAAATTIELRTKAMWGMVPVKGTFAATGGSGTIGADGSVAGTFTVDAASVSTKMKKRDEHLRSKDFFDVETYPTFVFTVSSARAGAEGGVVIGGTFSAHGQTRPLELSATVAPAGAGRVTVTSTFPLDRSEWGIDFAKMGAKLANTVTVTAVFAKG